MKYNVIGPFDVTFYGVVKEFSLVNNQQFKDIPMFWETVMKDNTFKDLLTHMDEWGVLALSYGYNPEKSTFQYMIGVRSDKEIQGYEKISFEQKMFAEFEAKGKLPKALQDTIQQVHKYWIKDSEYKYDYEPEVEIYTNDGGNSEESISYYLLPIKSK